ncbi:hypothetical protein QBC33DRAFT_536611 [Phialemonium atrogriseum]|uniref:Uncharacterized protein n=1 Tax=Phialemonium atrogriseum TaxID=1093897 RepID=A0AAJ0C155_9PEZI|nr:uncharacterized protein QBC33DRAFT_536611 [Phialemonium atrogriseum]KAK1768233.1 hypothetical protein QBC33DRAFT_536611 [Phialemonium atrogriseum]
MRSTITLLPILGLLSGLALATPAPVVATLAAPTHLVGEPLAADSVNATEVGRRTVAEPPHLTVALVSADAVNSTSAGVVKRAIEAAKLLVWSR